MTDKKISELSSNTALDGTELIPLVQSGGNVKALLSAVKTFIIDGLASTGNNNLIKTTFFADDNTEVEYSIDAAGNSRIYAIYTEDGAVYYGVDGEIINAATDNTMQTLGFEKLISDLNGYSDFTIVYALDADGNSRAFEIYGNDYTGESIIVPSLYGDESYKNEYSFINNLHQFRQKLMSLKVGQSTDPVVINFIGDSWIWRPSRGLNWIAKALKTEFGEAGYGYIQFCRVASTLWGSHDGVVTVSRSGTWTDSNHAGLPLPNISGASSSSGTITVSNIPSGDAIKLYHRGGGAIRYKYNSDAWIDLTLAGSVVAVETLTNGSGTLTIEVTSGNVVLGGIELIKNSAGIRVNGLGSTGSKSGHWADADATEFKTGVASFDACLTVILLNTNDQKIDNPALTKANKTTIVERLRETSADMSIIIVSPPENGDDVDGHVAPMSDYQKMDYALAQSLDCGFVNLQYVFGDTFADYSSSSDRPLMDSDNIHPSDIGGCIIADAEFKTLVSR